MSKTKFHFSNEDYFPYLTQRSKTAIVALEYFGIFFSSVFVFWCLVGYCRFFIILKSRRFAYEQRGSHQEISQSSWSGFVAVESVLVVVLCRPANQWQLGIYYRHGCRNCQWHRKDIGIACRRHTCRKDPCARLSCQYAQKQWHRVLDECCGHDWNHCKCCSITFDLSFDFWILHMFWPQSENVKGREWLLTQSSLDEVICLCTNLLDNQHMWISSNAALVLARISIEDSGCIKILSNAYIERTIKNLIDGLNTDNTGLTNPISILNRLFTIVTCDQQIHWHFNYKNRNPTDPIHLPIN